MKVETGVNDAVKSGYVVWVKHPAHIRLRDPLDTSLAHSSLCRLGRRALSAFLPWLLALLQHPFVPLVCSSFPPSFQPMTPPVGFAGQPDSLAVAASAAAAAAAASAAATAGAVELSDAVLLRRCCSASLPLSAFCLTLLCWIIATEVCKRRRQRGQEREGERQRVGALHSTAALYSLCFPGLVECSAGEQLIRRELPKGIYPPLFARPPSVHFWDRVQRRREEGGTQSRTSDSAAQLSVPPCSRDT
ncbi:hypothetical protein D5F01_LYC06391 [Larimichthys crocea]|uniref:Uncharacterized protein n=1 Tax=Larimichthys crocea TaxID=215358 RepID=A0A6G0IW08_LARCR|nr:hypothetical protein D5F01_LYC06391 [Larimichthys crocea]